GPTNQSISGGTLLSSNDESDFALLELNNTPPTSYNVCYSGWDATDSENSVSSSYGIHHPSGDVKKICFDDDAPYHDVLNSFVNQVWYIDEWELGVTEGGSSGSPLFNQNGLIIGQLAGGQAACNGDVNNGSFDYYGRMGVSWNYGSTPTTSLRFALDQANTGILIVPNSCNSDLPDLNASLGIVNGIPEFFCELNSFTPSVNVVNLGTETIEDIVLEVNLNGNVQLVEWSGNILPQANTFISLGGLTPSVGFNNLSIEIISVNGEEDTDALGNTASKDFQAFDQALGFTVNIDLDNYPEETTWIITSELNEVIASGGPYTDGDDPVSEFFCLGDGCYDFTIFDSANDGLCCGFGLGSYSVVDEFGTIYAQGDEFGSSETSEICSVLDTQNTMKGELNLYPNPASDVLKISAINDVIDQVRIYDISGKTVSEKTGINSSETLINTNALPSGLYVVEVVGTDGNSTRKKVIVANQD
ncbi:MAG TPA: T9SS type A sorting domain-containing protein, partial [Cryomorphaceae bacterium]|nr:T9SS type A sorting domain-containing protein [Cryomorphaceae bacterium]